MELTAEYEGFLVSPACLKPRVLTLHRATCRMSDSSSSSDIETIVKDIFNDDLDVIAKIQNAACIMGIDNGRREVPQYRGRVAGARNIIRGVCSCLRTT